MYHSMYRSMYRSTHPAMNRFNDKGSASLLQAENSVA
jgi:hypothetical protein